MLRTIAILSLLTLSAPLVAQQPAPAPPASQAASTPPTTIDTRLNDLDAFVAQTLKLWNVPGVAISVVKEDKLVLSRGYGERAAGQRMTEHTRFPIASMSKAFVSFGAGLLVDEGKMSFDAPVVTYLPGFALQDPAASAGVTLRDMLSHRTGMPRHDLIWYHNSKLRREDVLKRMPHLAPTAPLRAKWQYNNNMFMLSGLAIDRVSRRSWEEFTTAHIFQPLGMRRTGFSFAEVKADPDHTTGTEVRVGKRVDTPLFPNNPLMAPAGGIYSTADDLSRWMLVHLDGGKFGGRQIIQRATLAEMHNTQMVTGISPDHPEVIPTGYGLGWFTETYRGRPAVQHGGNLPGISTLVTLLPADELGVTVLVNQGASELPYALTRAILDRMLGLTPIDWTGDALKRKQAAEREDVAGRGNKAAMQVKGTRPSHKLADYVGTYVHPGYGAITISREGGRLVGRYNDDSSPLAHFHYDVFDAISQVPENIWTDARVQFHTDVAGRIVNVSAPLEPQLPAIMFGKAPDPKLSDPAYLRTLAGTYEQGGVKGTTSVSGTKLVLVFEGGRPAELVPSIDGEFVHPRNTSLRIRFKTDAKGRVTAMEQLTDTGIFEAKRID